MPRAKPTARIATSSAAAEGSSVSAPAPVRRSQRKRASSTRSVEAPKKRVKASHPSPAKPPVVVVTPLKTKPFDVLVSFRNIDINDLRLLLTAEFKLNSVTKAHLLKTIQNCRGHFVKYRFSLSISQY